MFRTAARRIFTVHEQAIRHREACARSGRVRTGCRHPLTFRVEG